MEINNGDVITVSGDELVYITEGIRASEQEAMKRMILEGLLDTAIDYDS